MKSRHRQHRYSFSEPPSHKTEFPSESSNFLSLQSLHDIENGEPKIQHLIKDHIRQRTGSHPTELVLVANSLQTINHISDEKRVSISNIAVRSSPPSFDEELQSKQDYMPVFEPPDGGASAWLVMVASFLCNGIIFGVINCYGVILPVLKKQLENNNVTEASTKASLVGSISVGMTFFLSPVAGILTDKYGIQKTSFAGGALAATGMFTSSFLCTKVEALYITYGLMFGTGASLAYTPSLVILGHYFRKYMGIVNGVVTAGSSVFTIIMPYVLHALIQKFGLDGCLRALTGLMAVLCLSALTFRPLIPPHLVQQPPVKNRNSRGCRRFLELLINFDIWKNKRYVIWTLTIPLSLFGYFVPYFHIVAFMEKILPDKDGKVMILCIGITSGVGRVVFGKVADMPKVNRILLQQISFISIGILTMLLTTSNIYWLLILFCLGMGLFDGCFISLLGPIAFDICGPSGASQAIGFLLGLCSIPLTFGPPIAGFIYDNVGNYTAAFIAAGTPPIIGALVMFSIYREKGQQTKATTPADNVASLPCKEETVANGALGISSPNRGVSSASTHAGPPPSYDSVILTKEPIEETDLVADTDDVQQLPNKLKVLPPSHSWHGSEEKSANNSETPKQRTNKESGKDKTKGEEKMSHSNSEPIGGISDDNISVDMTQLKYLERESCV